MESTDKRNTLQHEPDDNRKIWVGNLAKQAWDMIKKACKGVAGFFSNVTARILLGREEYAKMVREPVINAARDNLNKENTPKEHQNPSADKEQTQQSPQTMQEQASQFTQQQAYGLRFGEYLSIHCADAKKAFITEIHTIDGKASPTIAVHTVAKDNVKPDLVMHIDEQGNVHTNGSTAETAVYASMYRDMVVKEYAADMIPTNEQISKSIDAALLQANNEGTGKFTYYNIEFEFVKNDNDEYAVSAKCEGENAITGYDYTGTYTAEKLQSQEFIDEVRSDIDVFCQSQRPIQEHTAQETADNVTLISNEFEPDHYVEGDSVLGYGFDDAIKQEANDGAYIEELHERLDATDDFDDREL